MTEYNNPAFTASPAPCSRPCTQESSCGATWQAAMTSLGDETGVRALCTGTCPRRRRRSTHCRRNTFGINGPLPPRSKGMLDARPCPIPRHEPRWVHGPRAGSPKDTGPFAPSRPNASSRAAHLYPIRQGCPSPATPAPPHHPSPERRYTKRILEQGWPSLGLERIRGCGIVRGPTARMG